MCKKEISHMDKNNGNPDVVCEKSYTSQDNEAEPVFFFCGGGGGGGFLLNLLRNPKFVSKNVFNKTIAGRVHGSNSVVFIITLFL